MNQHNRALLIVARSFLVIAPETPNLQHKMTAKVLLTRCTSLAEFFFFSPCGMG